MPHHLKTFSLSKSSLNGFRLLVAGLRVVNGPFTSQKPATFYTQTALLFFAFNNLTYYGFLFCGIKHLNCLCYFFLTTKKYMLRIKDPYIQCCRMAHPAEH